MLGEYWGVAFPWFQWIVTAAWTLSLEITFYCWMGILFAANQLKHVRWYIAAWLLVQVLVDELAGARPVWGDILKTLFIFQYAHMFSMGLCLYLLFRRYAQPPSPPALIDNGETQPLLVQEGDQKRPAGQDNNPIQEQQPQQQQQQRGQDLARAILPELKVIWPEVALLIAIFCIAMWVKSPWGDVVRAYPNYRAVNAVFCLLAMGLFFTVIWMHRCREESGVARAVAMVLECRVSVFFGTISYALYLIHEEMGIYVF